MGCNPTDPDSDPSGADDLGHHGLSVSIPRNADAMALLRNVSGYTGFLLIFDALHGTVIIGSTQNEDLWLIDF